MDSTRIYQGITGNLEPRFVRTLERVAVNGMVPDLTIIIDVPADIGLERARERMAAGEKETAAAPDRFEKEALATHEKRREGFLELAQTEPERCRVVDGNADAHSVAAEIARLVDAALAGREGPAAAAGSAT
jgi:dTMP kinase